jgi:glycosyltransferase involved in cell wall biosynthesis
MNLQDLKVAIVHDWLTHYGGAERCLEELLDIFPQAEIFTLIYKTGSVGAKIEKRTIHTSFLQKFPFSKKLFRYLLPLMPLAIEQFRFNGYDLVISSSHAVAKGVITPSDCVHVSYMYTPMRYIWFMEDEYFGSKSDFPFFMKLVIKPILHYLRIWDKSSSLRVDKYIAISEYVASRIMKIYGFDSEVIYPPVDTERFINSGKRHDKKDYYLMITNYEPNKNTEIVLKAFRKLNQKLKVVGAYGRKGRKLKAKYRDCQNIELLGQVSPNQLEKLYSEAKALVAPGHEDFGMAVVEAMASGTPVIAYGKGGHLETVTIDPCSRNTDKNGANGVFFYEVEISAIIRAIREFECNYLDLKRNTSDCKDRLEKYNRSNFRSRFIQLIEKAVI